jgi:hypothetical protein
MGVLAPRLQLGLQSLAERRWRLGFHMVVFGHVLIAPLAPPLIFMNILMGFVIISPLVS